MGKKNLVIVESPAKAKTIEKILGKDFHVVASFGHVRDLPKSKLGVDVENNFKPSYSTIKGKGEVIKNLKDMAKKSDKVFLASDPDREGEAIAWHIAYALKLSENDPNRIEFNEITETAIKDSIKHPRKIDMDKVNAQQARRILDRLVGYGISSLLWKSISSNTSAGRVQSVALKLICDLEDEIKKFIPVKFWEIKGEFTNKLKLSFTKIILGNSKESSFRLVIKGADDTIKATYKFKVKFPESFLRIDKVENMDFGQGIVGLNGYKAKGTVFISTAKSISSTNLNIVLDTKEVSLIKENSASLPELKAKIEEEKLEEITESTLENNYKYILGGELDIPKDTNLGIYKGTVQVTVSIRE